MRLKTSPINEDREMRQSANGDRSSRSRFVSSCCAAQFLPYMWREGQESKEATTWLTFRQIREGSRKKVRRGPRIHSIWRLPRAPGRAEHIDRRGWRAG